MRVLIFGATGMLGQGVLLECLLDEAVTLVVTVGRSSSGRSTPKLRELVLPDLFGTAALSAELHGFDACFFCLGVSAFGMAEAAYSRVTHDLTMAIAAPLARDNPEMTFVYVSGAGTDIGGRAMWARVKGRTEAALERLPFKAVYHFRPGFVRPMDGVVSKTRLYRMAYLLAAPVASLLGVASPHSVTSTRSLGRAMIAIARYGYRSRILANRDINDAASRNGDEVG